MKKYTYQDRECCDGYRELHLLSQQIREIDDAVIDSTFRLRPRDVYFDIISMISTHQYAGHAIGLVGLRRTGKSTLLNQLHKYLIDNGMDKSEILHLTLSVIANDTEINRDDLDLQKVSKGGKLKYICVRDLTTYIDIEREERKIKCILIDEITLCEDLILAGKGLMDQLINSGILVIVAGTECLSLQMANEESLYGRLILKDISYISFKEYCRIKRMDTHNLKDLGKAFSTYIEKGNVLDDVIVVDDLYIESAVGVNVALSIINSDVPEFSPFDNNAGYLAELIIKYIRLLGETVTADAVNQYISRADITRAIHNENARRKDADRLSISKRQRTTLAVGSTESLFRIYNMGFDTSSIKLSDEQLRIIDGAFSKMGLLYNLSIMPCSLSGSGWPRSDDVFMLHGFIYHIVRGIMQYIDRAEMDISDEDKEKLKQNIESAALGRIIESIIVLHHIKKIEYSNTLTVCGKSYSNGEFITERKCTKPHLYKYNNIIAINGKPVIAEIDLVISEPDTIRLIEIKKEYSHRRKADALAEQ